MENKYKRLLLLLMGGIALIAFAAYIQTAPARRLRDEFSAPIVAVEIGGKTVAVEPYNMLDRAEFQMYIRHKDWPIFDRTRVTFILQSGKHVDCIYNRSGDEVRIAIPLSGTFFGIGVSKDRLWPTDLVSSEKPTIKDNAGAKP